MAEFSVNTNAVKTAADAEERLRKELADIQQAVREISGSLVIKTAASAGIKMRLNGLAGRVGNHRSSMGSMKNALERAVNLYEEAEGNICGYTENGIKAAKSQTSKTGSSFWNDLADLIGKIVQGLFSPITTAWSNLVSVIGGIIGNGDVTDSQPTAEWGTEQVSLTALALALIKRGSGGTTSGTTSSAAGSTTASGNFVQRTTAPVSENPNDYKYYFSGENPYPSGKEVPINNCTKYAFGRAYELLGYRPEPTPPGQGNANLWFSNFNPQYERSTDINKPRAGAIICWGGGQYGHVAVVEAVNGDQITYSDSSYPYTDNTGYHPGWTYMTHTVSINDLSNQMGASFQGYIYLPGVGES